MGIPIFLTHNIYPFPTISPGFLNIVISSPDGCFTLKLTPHNASTKDIYLVMNKSASSLVNTGCFFIWNSATKSPY